MTNIDIKIDAIFAIGPAWKGKIVSVHERIAWKTGDQWTGSRYPVSFFALPLRGIGFGLDGFIHFSFGTEEKESIDYGVMMDRLVVAELREEHRIEFVEEFSTVTRRLTSFERVAPSSPATFRARKK